MTERSFSTDKPKETIDSIVDFFEQQRANGFSFRKLGLACFGPLDLRRKSPTWGYITATPKPYWSNTPIAVTLRNRLNCEVFIDTDVNAAALAEHRWGAAQGCSVCVYVTVGTGIGLGIIANGKPLHGLIHPEGGHMLINVPDDPDIANIKGACPFHGNCVEGLASGSALAEIWGQPAHTLPPDHKAWDTQAKVLAAMCHNIMVCYSPEKIVLGGGVMQQAGLINQIIVYAGHSLANYIMLPAGVEFSDIIVPPGLGQFSGLKGAMAVINFADDA